MGKLQVFEVVFNGGQTVYRPGDTVAGEVRIVVTEEKGDIRGIQIKFVGKSYTHWSEEEGTGDNKRTVHYSWKIPYFKQEITLRGAGKGNSSANRITLPAGEHKFPFQFQIPVQSYPPPFEGVYGYVRYYVKATIDRPWKFDHHSKQFFSIMTIKDLNYVPNILYSPSNLVSKTVCCLCCASGPITLKGRIDKSGYVPGEYIFVSLELENNSSRSICSVTCSLKQRVAYFAKHGARTHSKHRSTKVAELKLDGCEAMESINLERQHLLIPPIPPICFENCPNIQMEYVVEIEADVSGTPLDAEVELPVTIGTVPAFEHTLRDPNQAPPMQPGIPGGYPPPQGPPGGVVAPGQPQPGYPAPGMAQPGYPPAGIPLTDPSQAGYPPPGQAQPGYPPPDPAQTSYPPSGYPPEGNPTVNQALLPPPPTYQMAVGGPQEISGKKGAFGTTMYAPQYPCYNPDTLYSAMGVPAGAPPGQGATEGQAPTVSEQPQSAAPPHEYSPYQANGGQEKKMEDEAAI